MDGLSTGLQLIIALVLGGLIGFEREINEKKRDFDTPTKQPTAVVGIRSFGLISLFGALSGILYQNSNFFAIILGVSVMVLLGGFYIIDSMHTRDSGITTELALLFSFFLGFLITQQILPMQILLALTVLVILLLSKKDTIKDFTEDVKRHEINSFIAYAVIALVVLPFLPNTTYALSDIPNFKNILTNFNFPIQRIIDIELFNPFKVWLIVTLMTGIDIAGYVLEKTIGQKRGWILTSIAGGFISSTATTQTIAQQSKEVKNSNFLMPPLFIANAASFVQVGIVLATINSVFLAKSLPTLGILMLSSIGIALYFLFGNAGGKKDKGLSIKPHAIFDLAPALKFAGIFLLVTVFSKVSLEFFGNSGLFITSAIGALAGIDAVLISTADLAGRTISYNTAVINILVVNAVNLLAKSLYAYLQGTKEFAIKVFLGMILIIASSCVGLLFI